MSWSPLTKPAPAAGRRAAVALSMSPGKGRHAPSMTLTLRLAQLENMAILQLGAGVRALLGGGEHEGMLRIEAGADILVGRPGGKRPAPDLVTIRLPLPPRVAPSRQKPVPCEHDFADGWLELTLPAWARPALPAAVPQAGAMPASPFPPAVAGAQRARDAMLAKFGKGDGA
jgi:hypothetical protein